MSESEIDHAGKIKSLKRLRRFFRKSLRFQKFPSLQTLISHVDDSDDDEGYEDEHSIANSRTSYTSIGEELKELHERLAMLSQQIMDIKKKNTTDLSKMSAVIKVWETSTFDKIHLLFWVFYQCLK